MTIEDRHLIEEYGIFSSRKKIIKYRWKIIKSYVGWEDYLGFAIFVIGVLGFIFDTIPFITELRAELVGIGITVLIIDNANEAIKRREEKKRLILQMGSPNNAFAHEAVRQLKATNWLYDGTLRGAFLFRADLSDVELALTYLERVDLSYANLQKTYLGGANLRHANLEGADLQQSDCERVHLHGANLDYANLQGAYLALADLSGARLLESNMSGTDLSYANLHDATFYRTNLMEANLKDAKVTNEQLAEAFSLEGATMPDGTLYKVEDTE